MTLTEEIKSQYTDALGLVSPHPTTPDNPRASDNGVMFTCEYLILYLDQYPYNNSGFTDVVDKYNAIEACEIEPGLLARAPKDTGSAPPDDMYAVAAFAVEWNNPLLCKRIYDYGMKHYGAFNPQNPGRWTTQAFLWRQPQLLAAVMAGADMKVPFVLDLIASLVILFSCMNTPKEDTDPRRLSWLLIKALSPTSKMMRFASKYWYKRLYKDYGPTGMKAVRQIYYKGTEDKPHPFVTYSVD